MLCNAIKCATMFWAVWYQRENTFVTFGDAVASWLDNADPSTTDRCYEGVRSIARKSKTHQSRQPRPIDNATRRWRLSVSKKRWATTILLLSAGLAVSYGCLGLTVTQMKNNTSDTIASLGFGAVNSNMLFNDGEDYNINTLATTVLFANLPQVVLSFEYLLLNALFTCMLLAREYSGYEVRRKPLRVTTPMGKQRATYWLQLPYTYGLPLMATSATLHWLISQSVFLVRVETYYRDTSRPSDSSAVGLSPAPMVAVVILGTCLTAIAIGLGFKKLEGHAMPVAASCSLALAAAAHRPAEDVDAAILPVKWGEVVKMGDADVGHCCFTSQEVVAVVPGRKYA